MAESRYDIAAAFPDRPLRILDPGAISAMAVYLGAAFFVWFAVFAVKVSAPRLLRDFGIMRNLVVVPDASIRNGKCERGKSSVTCQADISYTVDGEHYAIHARASVPFGSGSYPLVVVRSSVKPEHATLSIAIDYFWYDVLCLAGMVILPLGAAAFGIRRRLASLATRREAKVLHAVPVEIIGAQKGVVTASLYRFKTPVEGKMRSFVSRLPRGKAPFQAADGSFWAVLPTGTRLAVLLDKDLRRVDLTDQERRHVQEVGGIYSSGGAPR